MIEINPDPVTELRSSMWAPNWPHEKPDKPFTTAEAHAAMQTHIDCDIWSCARKRAAWDTLVDVGAIIPDPGR